MLLSPLGAGLSHMASPVVSTEGRRPEWRDLLSTISRLLWREGLSAPRFALRSRRRKLPYAIALPKGERNSTVPPQPHPRLPLSPALSYWISSPPRPHPSPH